MPEELVEVELTERPNCQLCNITHPSPAMYDFRMHGGQWAYGCESCYQINRLYTELGMGKGQRIRVRGEN